MAEALVAIGGASAVLELSKAACSLAHTLYVFCRDTKNVNETVKELAGEVKALGNAQEWPARSSEVARNVRQSIDTSPFAP